MARYDFPHLRVREKTPSKLVVANNDRVGLTVIRALFVVAGLAFLLTGLLLKGAVDGSLPLAALVLPLGLALLGYGLFGLFFLPMYGRVVADRQTGLIEAELERTTPFNGPQGKSRRQKVIVSPYEQLTVINVVPGNSALVGKRIPFIATQRLQGYRVELVLESGDSLRIPFDTHALTIEEAGWIHQWLVDAGVRVELIELSGPNGPMEASDLLNLAYLLAGSLAMAFYALYALYTFLKPLLAR